MNPRRTFRLGCALALALAASAAAAPRAPNVVVILLDDLGWGDFSCFGNTAARTPHIDRLAREGLRFEQFYVASPICSPSRAGITTGQYPHRWRIFSYLNNRAENAIRPFVIGRKNWLFSDSPRGATASAQLYSLVETAKANEQEPYAWLRHVLERLPQARSVEDYEALLPWNCKPATTL